MSVMVLLKAWSPPTGPGAGEEEDQEDRHTRRLKNQCMVSRVPYNNLPEAVMCFGKMLNFNLKTHLDSVSH